MRTTFFNVGHGEAIVIELSDLNRIILRDCGACSNRTPYSVSIQNVVQKCLQHHFPFHSFTYDAVLSHYHSDHYNGFEELFFSNSGVKIFDNAVIPTLDLTPLDGLPSVLVRSIILLYWYYRGKKRGSLAKKYFKILRIPLIMAMLSRRVIVGRHGVTIPDWNTNKFLWPSAASSTKSSLKILREYEKLDLPENIEDILIEQAAKAVDLLAPIFNGYEPEGLNERLKELDQLLENFVDLPEMLDLSKLQTASSSYLDNNGVIFEIESNENSILMLSDAHDSEIKKMLKYNKINRRTFTTIKAAHHGTRGSNALIAANIFSQNIVCSSGIGRAGQPNIGYTSVGKHVYCTGWDSCKWKNKALFQVFPTCKISL